MKWNQQDYTDLLLLALAQAPSFSIDYEKIRAGWPQDREVPTARAIKNHLFDLRKGSNAVGAATAGVANRGRPAAVNKSNAVDTTPAGPTNRGRGKPAAVKTKKAEESTTGDNTDTDGKIPFPSSKLKELAQTRKSPPSKPTAKSTIIPTSGKKRKASAAGVDSESEEAMSSSKSDDDTSEETGLTATMEAARKRRTTPRRSVTRTTTYTQSPASDSDTAMDDAARAADDSEDAFDPVKEREQKLRAEQKIVKKQVRAFVKDEELED